MPAPVSHTLTSTHSSLLRPFDELWAPPFDELGATPFDDGLASALSPPPGSGQMARAATPTSPPGGVWVSPLSSLSDPLGINVHEGQILRQVNL